MDIIPLRTGRRNVSQPRLFTLQGYYGARPLGGLDHDHHGHLARYIAHSAQLFALNTIRYLEYATTKAKVWLALNPVL